MVYIVYPGKEVDAYVGFTISNPQKLADCSLVNPIARYKGFVVVN
jgi:hypothetical protein